MRQAALGFLAAAGVLTALSCGGGDITTPPTTGSLRITSSTSGPTPDADGYTITLDGTDRGQLGTSGAVTVDGLAPGEHLIGLSGVAGNCGVEGENPRSVTVTAGESATVGFAVTCVTLPPTAGTLHISTTTTGSNLDPDGYAFAVDGATSQPIGVNASATLPNVAAGAHSVQLSGVAGNCSVGGTNPRSVTVSAGATADVSFAITCTATTGSIEVTTTTKGAKPDPDGYTVSVDQGNPQTIGTGATITVPTLPPGSHTVALAGMARNCRVEGENPRTVTLTVGQKATTTFTVLCPTFVTYRATDLGTLATGRSSSATDVNSAGQVVGWSGIEVRGLGDIHAFLWENGVMTDLTPGVADNWASAAAAINPTGQVVGRISITNLFVGDRNLPWLWEQGALTYPFATDGWANDINPAGQVVGCAEIEMFQCHAALWQNGAMTDLGTLDGAESEAHGIDPTGRVVGTSGGRAFLWEKGVMTDLNIPGAGGIARKINVAGQVIGTVSGVTATHGFLWEKGAITDLGAVVLVNDINSHGQVVGWREVGGTDRAFVWENGIMTDLPGPSRAYGINDEGQVVGSTGTTDLLRATLWTPE